MFVDSQANNYLTNAFAAPNPTHFWTCEVTSTGCAFRINGTNVLIMGSENTTLAHDYTTKSLVFEMLGNETMIINGSAIPRSDTFALLHLSYRPADNGTTGLHMVVDLNGQPQSEALEIEVNASSMIGGNPSVFSALIDKGSSTGGTIHAFNVIAINGGLIDVEGLAVFSGVIAVHQHSGVPVAIERALTFDGIFEDVTAAFASSANDTSLFVSVTDEVYVGQSAQFNEIQFNLATIASGAGIRPIFEFSDGAGGWILFSPIDGTDGMRSDGAVVYEPDDLTGWSTDTVSGFGGLFWIRITRTQVGLGIVPIEDTVQVVSATEFIWDEFGNLEIFGMNVTSNLIVDGTSNFGGIVDGEGNAFNNLGNIGNDLGVTNTLVFTAMNGGGSTGSNWDWNNNLITEMGTIFFTSGGGLKSQSGGNPQILTLTYPVTIAWNSTWGHSGFTLAATMDANLQRVDDVLDLRIDTAGGHGLYFDEGASNRVRIFYEAGGNDLLFRLANNVGASTTFLSIAGEAATSTITMVNANFAVPTNNTLSMFSDAIRVADIYSVVSHQKSLDTGAIYENEIIANRGESFSNGDVVCLFKLWSFTKCSATYTFVLSAVEYIGKQGIIGFENITKYRLIKETEFYAKNVTDADGKIYLERAIRDILISFRDTRNITLDDGSVKTIPFINYRNSWINQSYTERVPIWGNVDQKLMLVFEKPMQVKICSPVLQGQFLVAGLNGCADGVDNLQPRQRYIGRAAEDSNGQFVGALVGWN